MSTYQNYSVDQLEIASLLSNKFERVTLAALFVTAVFIVPPIVGMKFLFF
jgi:hypothetical protein